MTKRRQRRIEAGDIIRHSGLNMKNNDANRYLVLDAGCNGYGSLRVYCLAGHESFVGKTFHFSSAHSALKSFERV